MSNIDDDPGAPTDRVRADSSQPQNQMIAIYSVLAVGALFCVKFAADAYLESNTRAVRTGHLETSVAREALDEYRSEARASLEGGEMSIGEAMSALSGRDRDSFVQIRPTSDDNDGARLGWATLPVVAPEAAPHATRSVFTLSEEEMPPGDPEVDALESGAPPPAAAPRAPAAPRPAPAPAPTPPG